MGILQDFLGPLFIGHTIATALWGVTCVQAWTYYTYPRGLRKDPKWLKLLVFIVWAADTVHQILISMSVYDYCVTYFGNPLLLNTIPRGGWTQIFTVQLVVLLVHAFYIYRIWRLSSGSLYLTIPVLLLASADFGVSADEMVAVAKSDSWTTMLHSIGHITVVADALMFATDMIISGFMCYLLARNTIEYEKTRSIVKRVVIFTLTTNLITSICALMVLVMAAAFPTNVYYIPFFNIVSRLYANSLMAALNMRPYLAKGTQTCSSLVIAQNTSIQLANWQHGNVPRAVHADSLGCRNTEWLEDPAHMGYKLGHAHKELPGVNVQIEQRMDV